MDFIEFEANVESKENPIYSSEEVEELTNDKMDDFFNNLKKIGKFLQRPC